MSALCRDNLMSVVPDLAYVRCSCLQTAMDFLADLESYPVSSPRIVGIWPQYMSRPIVSVVPLTFSYSSHEEGLL